MSGETSATVLARAAWSRLVEPGDLVAGALMSALGPVDALDWLRSLTGAADDVVLPGLPTASATRLAAAVRRWALRLPTVDEARDVRVFTKLGGTVLVPEDPRWPSRLLDLGPAAPPCSGSEVQRTFESSSGAP